MVILHKYRFEKRDIRAYNFAQVKRYTDTFVEYLEIKIPISYDRHKTCMQISYCVLTTRLNAYSKILISKIKNR